MGLKHPAYHREEHEDRVLWGERMKGIVGVVGLGIMGGAMARNLTKAGWEVVGFDIVADRRS